MKVTENQLESAIIELLETEGHVVGEAIERQPQVGVIHFLAREEVR